MARPQIPRGGSIEEKPKHGNLHEELHSLLDPFLHCDDLAGPRVLFNELTVLVELNRRISLDALRPAQLVSLSAVDLRNDYPLGSIVRKVDIFRRKGLAVAAPGREELDHHRLALRKLGLEARGDVEDGAEGRGDEEKACDHF